MKSVWILASLLLSVSAARAEEGAPCRVFFIPGAFGHKQSGRFLKWEDYFREYRSFFESKGCKVALAEFPPAGTIEERALILTKEAEQFDHAVPGAPMIWIAHSQGGLDARLALNRDVPLPAVRALVTIGTPHQGSKLAEWVVRERDRGGMIYWILRVFAGYDLRRLPFLAELTEGFIKPNESVFKPKDGVRYYSGVASCTTHCHWALRFLTYLAKIPEGDGVIEASSQEFGEVIGRYDLDHISSVGVDDAKRPERMRWLADLWRRLVDDSSKLRETR